MKGQILTGLLIVATIGLMAAATVVVPAMEVQNVKAVAIDPRDNRDNACRITDVKGVSEAKIPFC